jgi:hypothetical protein
MVILVDVERAVGTSVTVEASLASVGDEEVGVDGVEAETLDTTLDTVFRSILSASPSSPGSTSGLVLKSA